MSKTKGTIIQQHTIKFIAFDDIPLQLGAVYYTVEKYDCQSFYGVCPVCGDNKKVVINGFDFTCPKCNGYGGSKSSLICVDRFTVKRWRLSGVSEELNIHDWNPSDGHYRAIKIRFTRTKRSEGTETFEINSYQYGRATRYGNCEQNGEFGDQSLRLDNKYSASNRDDISIFVNYADAAALAKNLNEKSIEKINAFNETAGTKFNFEWPENDVKSK